MKKSLVVLFVLIIAAMSVPAVSAAYYDQMGNKLWCNSDSYGCWVTGDDGEQIYIMFWSEAARDYIMGPGSNAPLGTNPGSATLGLFPAIECTVDAECGDGMVCSLGMCVKEGSTPTKECEGYWDCSDGMRCVYGQCQV